MASCKATSDFEICLLAAIFFQNHKQNKQPGTLFQSYEYGVIFFLQRLSLSVVWMTQLCLVSSILLRWMGPNENFRLEVPR